ncbi:WD40 repeat domain-containing protein [Phormidesmis priestleyi]|uniref:WD40 repeat domain-containing protein n=1 Tax=Phormidesmis priestleyi TaxID=268141 RepID=UPI000933C685|nr:WD40 repeat domain-containing protein [Phormidesmis priestleyi]
MSQKKHLILGGVGIIAIVALLVGAYFLLDKSIAARVSNRVCIPSYVDGLVCYSQHQSLTTEQTTKITVSPDGKILASSTHDIIHLWNLETGKKQRTLSGHRDWVSALAISPDGQTLASASLDRTIKLWNLETGQLLKTLYSGRATTIAFSPDGQTLASGSRLIKWADGTLSRPGVQLWNLAAQEWQDTIGDQPVVAIAFSPNSELLAAGKQKTYLWRVSTKQLLQTVNSGDLTALTFSRDGETLLTGSSRMKLWSVTSGMLLHTFGIGASDLALSPDGQTLVAAVGGTMQFWQPDIEDYLGMLRGSSYSGLSVTFGLNGNTVISSSSDGIRIWHPNSFAAPEGFFGQ